ncbi:MAG: hypothetical protein QOD99_2495, partial [Chthoniobacter sp.]|nr:hypothetical protein [Chthoniobacter sp.]
AERLERTPALSLPGGKIAEQG